MPEQRTPLITTSLASGVPCQYQVSWEDSVSQRGTTMQAVLISPSYPPSDQFSTGFKIFTDESPTQWAALSHLNPSDIKSFYVIGAMPY